MIIFVISLKRRVFHIFSCTFLGVSAADMKLGV
jgi:hypothetical protein